MRSEIGELLSTNFSELAIRVNQLDTRVAGIENRLLSYHRNRWDAIFNLADYLVGAELPGDYYEFGVYKGETFSYAITTMAPLFKEMRFVALDSFEGLPELRGVDLDENYSSGFYQSQFTFSKDGFIANLLKLGIDMNRVIIIKGWFEKNLNLDTHKSNGLGKIAAAWIDCDLYESTVPVLQYITPHLQPGTVLLFDDWHCFRNLPDRGQQRACREWLADNPQIRLNQLFSFGFHGQAFTIGSM